MWDNNIYNNPEKFGLEIVGQFDWHEPNYDFDMLVVWKEKRGKYWIGEDSGCSCPSPFEDFTDINQLDGPYTKDGLRKRIEFRIGESADDGWGYSKAHLLSEMRAILSRLS